MVEFDYATIEHRLRELAFLNSGVRIVLTDARPAEPKREELYYEGGLEAFVRYLDRAKTPLIDKPILIRGEKRPHQRRGRAVVERQLPRERAAVHQQHPAARRRHASDRPAQRADAAGHRLCRALRPRQEGEGRRHRRRLPRGPDLRALGQVPGPEILVADQGQAGLLRGAAGGRGPRQRDARAMVRGAPGRGARSSSARWSRRRRRARRRARRAS